MIKILNHKILIILNIVFILLILSINFGFGIYIDGLPWSNKIEAILVLCLFPIIIIFNYKFLNNKKIFLIIFSILVFKIIGSVLFQQKGIYFDVYSQLNSNELISDLESYIHKNNKQSIYNMNQIEKIKLKFLSDNEIKKIKLNKTYDTFWNKNHSAKITKPLINKNNFPLDWARGYSSEKWEKLNIKFNIFGFVKLRKNEVLLIEANGLENLNELNKINDRIIFIKNSKNFEKKIINKSNKILNEHVFSLENYILNYKSELWSFIPLIYNLDSNKINGAFFSNSLTLDNAKLNIDSFENIYFYYTLLIETVFILIIFLWLLNTINNFLIQIFEYKNLLINWSYFSIFCLVPFLIYYLFYKYNFFIFSIVDSINTFQLSLSILIQFSLVFYLSYKKILNVVSPIQILISLIIIPTIFYFSLIFGNSVYEINNFPFTNKEMDDWTILHLVSRLITLGDFATSRFCLQNFYEFSNDNWLTYINIKEVRNIICDSESLANLYFHNPLYRYLLSSSFIIFGHGSFVVKIIDLWCIIFITIFIAKLLYKLKFNYYYIYYSSIIYLFINFAGPYRYLIGRGKEEFISTFFIFLSITILYFHKKNNANFLLAVFFSIIAFQLRLDYVFFIFSIILFYFEPINGNALLIIKKIFKYYSKRIFIFCFLISLSIIFLSIRSYWLTGYLYPVHPFQFVMVMNTDHSIYYKFYDWINHLNYVLSSGYGFPSNARFPSIILLLGTFFLLSSFFVRSLQIKFNISYSVSVCVLAIIISYMFFQKPTYPPRSSIHLLPFSTIGFIYILYIMKYYIDKYELSFLKSK